MCIIMQIIVLTGKNFTFLVNDKRPFKIPKGALNPPSSDNTLLKITTL